MHITSKFGLNILATASVLGLSACCCKPPATQPDPGVSSIMPVAVQENIDECYVPLNRGVSDSDYSNRMFVGFTLNKETGAFDVAISTPEFQDYLSNKRSEYYDFFDRCYFNFDENTSNFDDCTFSFQSENDDSVRIIPQIPNLQEFLIPVEPDNPFEISVDENTEVSFIIGLDENGIQRLPLWNFPERGVFHILSDFRNIPNGRKIPVEFKEMRSDRKVVRINFHDNDDELNPGDVCTFEYWLSVIVGTEDLNARIIIDPPYKNRGG